MLPTFVIMPLQPAVPPRAADVYIFLSPHAVKHGFPFLLTYDSGVNHATILAVGQATARELNNAGINGVETPPENLASSEGLLTMACLQARQVRGRRVILVCGAGGRTLLAKELHTRGAHLERLEVYGRVPSNSDIAVAIQTAAGRRPDVIVVTSVESMENLAHLIRTQRQEWLFTVPLVVMSERIAAECRHHGFTATVHVAASAGDDGLIAALLEYASVHNLRKKS